MAHDAHKAALIAALDRARSQLAVNAGALREDLDVGRRAHRSFERHRFTWLGGSAFAGVLLAMLSSRKKEIVITGKSRKNEGEKTAVKAGLLLGVLKITFDLAKPILLKWAGRRVADYVSHRAYRSQAGSRR